MDIYSEDKHNPDPENRGQLLAVLDIPIQLKTRPNQIFSHMIQKKKKKSSTTVKYVSLVFRFCYPLFIFRLFCFLLSAIYAAF